MIYALLTLPVVSRSKISSKIISGTYSLRIRFNNRYSWIGLDWIGSAKMDPCPTPVYDGRLFFFTIH